MRCATCGTDNAPDSRFCGGCGARASLAPDAGRVAPTAKIPDDASFPSVPTIPRTATPQGAVQRGPASLPPQMPPPGVIPTPPPGSLHQQPRPGSQPSYGGIPNTVQRPASKPPQARVPLPATSMDESMPMPAARPLGLIAIVLVCDLGLAAAGAVMLSKGLATDKKPAAKVEPTKPAPPTMSPAQKTEAPAPAPAPAEQLAAAAPVPAPEPTPAPAIPEVEASKTVAAASVADAMKKPDAKSAARESKAAKSKPNDKSKPAATTATTTTTKPATTTTTKPAPTTTPQTGPVTSPSNAPVDPYTTPTATPTTPTTPTATPAATPAVSAETEVNQNLARSKPTFDRCAAGLAGTMKVAFQVLADGRIANASAVENNTGNADAGRCIASTIMTWHLSPHAGAALNFVRTFTY